MRQTIAEQLAQLVRALAGYEPLDFDLPRRVARRRADQGVPMAALLHAYRLGGEVIWEHAVEVTGGLGDTVEHGQVLNAANAFFSLTDRYSEVIRASFEDTVRDRFRCSQQARAALLDALFDGGRESLPLTADVARILDVPVRAQFVAVAADVTEEGDDGLADIEARLRSMAIRSAWRRRSERQFGVVVLDGDAQRRVRTARGDARGTFQESYRVQPVLRRPRRHRGIRESRRRRGAPRSIRSRRECRVSTTVRWRPSSSRTRRSRRAPTRAVLGPLLQLDRAERSAVLETLRAWRDAGGSTALAAERLFCHRNTVRNRLQRVEAMTGRSLDEPLGCAEVCMALDAMTLLGDEAWG